jgi:hypothetical protein
MRKYAMAKRRPGEWHFLGNDRRTYWRVIRHYEDGVYQGDRDVSGWYWSLERLHDDRGEDGATLVRRSDDGTIGLALDADHENWTWATWDPMTAMLPSRADALAEYDALAEALR